MQQQERVQQTAASSLQPPSRLPWWIVIVVILGSLLMTAGAVIALKNPDMLVAPNIPVNDAVHVYAGYMASRNLALAGMLLAALWLRARGALRTLMLLTAFIQLLDAGMDAFEGRWAIVPGVLVFGIVFFIGLSFLRKES